MGGPDAFESGGVPWQKTLAKRVLMEEKTPLPFCELGWLVHYLGVIFAPSELPTSGTVSSTGGRPCRSLRRGLNAGASPPPSPPSGLNGDIPGRP